MSSSPSNSKPLVLITGATGHLGFRTLVLALQAGYQARVAIRKPDQADWMLETTSIKPFVNDVSFVRVPDITAPLAYDEAIKGVKYAIHVASPIPTKPEYQNGDWRSLYYEPATNGTVSLLSAAAKMSSVEAVVITSSVAILRRDVEIAGQKDIQPNLSASDADRVENFGEAYGVSKVLAYHAAKDFIDSQQPAFKTIFVLPGYIQGPNELLRQEKEFFSGSNEGTINAITGNLAAYAKPASQVWLDDVARAHVVALQQEAVHDGDNLIVVGRSGFAEKGASVHWDEVANPAAKKFSGALEKGIIQPVKGQQTALRKYDVAESEAKLGFEFSGPDMWVEETASWWLKWHGHEASVPSLRQLRESPTFLTTINFEQTRCQLRNAIYELAFTADHNEGGKVRLFEAKPPTKGLLLSCHQTYIEAKAYYVEAYQKYWRTTELAISTSELKRKSIEVSDVKGQDLDKVTKLGVWEPHADSGFMRFKFVLNHGVWTMGDAKVPPIDRPQDSNSSLIFGVVQETPQTIRASLALRLHHAQSPTVPLRQLLALLVWSFDEDKSNKIHKEAIPIEWLPLEVMRVQSVVCTECKSSNGVSPPSLHSILTNVDSASSS